MSSAFNGAVNLLVIATDVPNLSNVTTLENMFKDAVLANPDTSNWNTANIFNMNSIFSGAISANPDTSNWNTSMVVTMKEMFSGAVLANPNTNNWDISGVADMSLMFSNVTLPTVDYDKMLIGFAAQDVQTPISFHGGNSRFCSILSQVARDSLMAIGWSITDGGICETSEPSNDFVITVKTDEPGGIATEFKVLTVGGGYNYNIDCNDDGNLEATAQTGNYTCDYSGTGAGIYSIRIKDNSGSRTGFPRGVFNSADIKLKILSVDQWGTGVWKNMLNAYNGAENLMINAIDIPNVSQVINMRLMFSGAMMVNLDTRYWDTSSVLDMGGMFRNASMANPDVTNWNTASVTDMSFMFDGATSANPNVSLWNTQSVTNMNSMFAGAIMATPNVSLWDTTLVTNMSSMFSGADLANPIISNWDISDGGYCDVVFSNGFETNVVVFDASQVIFNLDLTQVDWVQTDESPTLVAFGIDDIWEEILPQQINQVYLW
jgi:surface protein